MKALAFCLLSLGCAATAQAEELGRLFYTPMQRADMDRKRLSSPSKGESNAAQLTINGRIIRGDGKTITWVNGVQQDSPQSNRAKVGQTIDAATGEAQDNGGRLVVRPTR